jgi:Putative Ig domain
VLVGIALVAPQLTLTPSPQSFGTVVVGASPVDRTLTLTNSTVQSGSLTAINVAGTGYARNGGTCPTTFPATIAGNFGCTVIVRFTATVVGTPAGSVDVTGDAAVSAVLSVTVVDTLAATPTSVNTIVLSPVNLTLNATGGTSPYTWLIVTGNLPAGLTLIGNTVSGTPTAAGNSSVTFKVTDGSGQTATLTVNFTITAPPTLDIDDSAPTTPYDAATDGMLLMRYLLGFRDAALTTGAISPSAGRDATQIAAHIAANLTRLDVDGDGKTLATSDGVMILRRLLGITSPAAITQGFKNSSRSDSDVVSAIDALKP